MYGTSREKIEPPALQQIMELAVLQDACTERWSEISLKLESTGELQAQSNALLVEVVMRAAQPWHRFEYADIAPVSKLN